MNTKKIGIYVHIPFCKKKCEYCDFKSYAGKEKWIDEYAKWLLQEIEEVGVGNRIDYENGRDKLAVVQTVYIGGGTPSYIDASYITAILNTIYTSYILDAKLAKGDAVDAKQLLKDNESNGNNNRNIEITLEVNPGTVNREKLETYYKSGVNRLSIGLQETHDNLLKELGRIHTWKEFLETYQTAREVGFENINVDLMLGLPQQNLGDLEESLDTIIRLNPEHVSVYSLILEEGTPFYEKWQEDKLELPNDETERKMYWLVKKKLEEAGYIHYEISNFAKKGYASKHNLACWNQEEYIGFGVAAHSYTNNVRYSNIDTIEEYIENFEKQEENKNFVFHEKQTKESKMKEYMMLGLRKIDGIRVQAFKEKFGENPIFVYHKELEKLVREELVEIDGDTIQLTNKGLDLANLVWEEFV